MEDDSSDPDYVDSKRVKIKTKYTLSDVNNAILAVREGMGRHEAAAKFNIPRSTLEKKLTEARHGGVVKMGKIPRLGWDQEVDLAHRLKQRLDKGLKVTDNYIVECCVEAIHNQGKKVTDVFPNGGPGKKWIRLFLARHPVLATKLKKCRRKGGYIQEQKPVSVRQKSIPAHATKPPIPMDVEVITVQPVNETSDDPTSSPHLSWCGPQRQTSQSNYFGVESLVECELRPTSPQIKNYIGRELELQQIISLIQSRPRGHIFSSVVTGPPGIGKTELLLRVVTSLQSFHYVLWLRGDSLADSIERSASLLGVANTTSAVFTACSSQSTLVLYDNVASPEQLQDWLPPCNIDASRIVGVQLLMDSLNVPMPIATDISQRLNHLPLALQLVIEYKKQLQADKEMEDPYVFLRFRLATSERDGYSKSLFEVLDQSIDQVLEGEMGLEARNMLNLIAFMDPLCSSFDEKALARTEYGSAKVTRILKLLQNFSLVQEESDGLVMYRLYKAILRAK
ncbi:hypothetical protein B566_EDAN012213 [Ephemera danica]|nr:hypothetical protein B566_EDAN012213 [Ephemera danica]